jgi:hypothetical protein
VLIKAYLYRRRLERVDEPRRGWDGVSIHKAVVQNEQRHNLVSEEGSDYPGGQPRREGLLIELLDKITGK